MAKKKKDQSPKKWIIVISVILGMCFFLGFLSLVLYNKKQIPAKASTRSAKTTVSGVTVGGKGTPEYNANLKELGKIEAEDAEKKGKTYIAPVVGSSVEDKNQNKSKTILVPKAPLSASRQRVRQKKDKDPYPEKIKEAIDIELGQVISKLKFESQAIEVYQLKEDQDKSESKEKRPAQMAEISITLPPLPLIPGDVLYAVNEQTINSDIPSPAGIAKILSGKLKNCRLIGGFKRHADYLLLEYVQLIKPDGTTYPIKAYAVNPETDTMAVRSKVDHHYLTRWGGLVAASFLEGFGEAVKNDGAIDTFVYNGGVSTVKQYPGYQQD